MQKQQPEQLDLQLFDCWAIKSNLKITQRLLEKKKKDSERGREGEREEERAAK